MAPQPARARRDLRARLRPLVSQRAWILAHRTANLAAAVRHLPPRDVLRLYSNGRGAEPFLELHPRNLRHPFHLPVGRAAQRNFVEVVLRETYAIHRLTQPSPVILDGGAFVGDSAAWLLSRYPTARVISIEPTAQSHALLLRNLAPYGERAVAVRAALWGRSGSVTMIDEGVSTSISATDLPGKEGESVRAVTPTEILDELGVERVDLFKLDVEGAERSLFTSSGADAWIERVGAVLMELHGDDVEAQVVPRLHRHGFSVRRHRGLYLATRPC